MSAKSVHFSVSEFLIPVFAAVRLAATNGARSIELKNHIPKVAVKKLFDLGYTYEEAEDDNARGVIAWVKW